MSTAAGGAVSRRPARAAVAGMLLGACLGGLLTGCSGGPSLHGPTLRFTGPGEPAEVTTGITGVAVGDTVSIGYPLLCVDGTAPVTVTEVRPAQAAAGAVTAYDLAPVLDWDSHELWGERRGPLRDGVPAGRRIVLRPGCSEPYAAGRSYELRVQLRRGPDGPASTGPFQVVYQSSGRSRVLTIPLVVEFCAPAGC